MGAARTRRSVGGILLTGGSSRRLGLDKASLEVGGETLARRLGSRLARAVTVAVEVGPGLSGLPALVESPRGAGPLAALVAGAGALREEGVAGPVLLLACDLPFVGVTLLRRLARWPGEPSVVPVVDGRAQLVVARWAPAALERAAGLVAIGERSLRALLEERRDLALVTPEALGVRDPQRTFADLDTPEDLARLGEVLRRRRDRPGAGVAGRPARRYH